MSKKIQVSLGDDLYQWLQKEADFRSIKVATLCTVLLGEAKKADINRSTLQMMFQRINALTPEQFVQMTINQQPDTNLHGNIARSAVEAMGEKIIDSDDDVDE